MFFFSLRGGICQYHLDCALPRKLSQKTPVAQILCLWCKEIEYAWGIYLTFLLPAETNSLVRPILFGILFNKQFNSANTEWASTVPETFIQQISFNYCYVSCMRNSPVRQRLRNGEKGGEGIEGEGEEEEKPSLLPGNFKASRGEDR